MRPPKQKKVVDTKASKGRKLRYEVHEKLQNFMVPIPAQVMFGAVAWGEQQTDELFASLLGTPGAAAPQDAPMDVDGEARPAAVLASGDGFRVFG